MTADDDCILRPIPAGPAGPILGLTVAGLLVLTVGTTALLIALRPAGWAPVRVLVAFLAGGIASLVGADARLGLFGGALLTGAALASVAVRVRRSGRVAAAARPHG